MVSVAAAQKVWTWRDAGNPGPALKFLNTVGAIFGRDSKAFVPEQLIAAAIEQSGLSDFGDSAFREGLDKVCESYSTEANFNMLGWLAARKKIVDTLVMRLKIVDWAKHHPEIRQQQIKKPWILIGLPRSGTTLTANLFDLDAHVRSPLAWEMDYPVPPATLATRYSDPRIATSAKMLGQLYKINPAVQAMHLMEPMTPQECVFLTSYDFRSLTFQGLSICPRYGEWCVNSDMHSTYALHKTVLQIWQNEIDTRSWALKAPNHMQAIGDLMATYPDARIVWLHRDPASCIPSMASLFLTFYAPMVRSQDPVITGSHMNWMYGTGLRRTMAYDAAAKDEGNEGWCAHLHYADLMQDPVGALRGVYRHFGEEMEAEHESRINAWMRQRPKNVFGSHKYVMEDFGMRRDAMRAEYAEYTARYGVALEH